VFWIWNEDEKFDLNFFSLVCSISETMLRKKKCNEEERSFAKSGESDFCCELTAWP